MKVTKMQLRKIISEAISAADWGTAAEEMDELNTVLAQSDLQAHVQNLQAFLNDAKLAAESIEDTMGAHTTQDVWARINTLQEDLSKAVEKVEQIEDQVQIIFSKAALKY